MWSVKHQAAAGLARWPTDPAACTPPHCWACTQLDLGACMHAHCCACMPHAAATMLRCRSPLDIEAAGVPPPPEVDDYLKSRLDKFYAQMGVSE
jgi:hypothetical protein